MNSHHSNNRNINGNNNNVNGNGSSTTNEIDTDISLASSSNLSGNRKWECSSCTFNCCNRLKSEWGLSLFSLRDTTGKVIDIKETFAPGTSESSNSRTTRSRRMRILYGMFKATIFIWTLSVLIMDIHISSFSTATDTNTDDNKEFWLAYLTNWGLIICFATNLFSLGIFLYFQEPGCCSTSASTLTSTNANTNTNTNINTNTNANTSGLGGQRRRLSINLEAIIIKIIWATSIVTINVALLIVLLYWTLEYKNGQTPIDYFNCMKHGIIALYTTVDILIINKTPIRLKQIAFVILFELLYFLWLMIHAVTGIGTPYSDNDPTTDDDALYSTVNWNKRPGGAVIIVVGVIVVLTPVMFLVLWFLSSSCLLEPRYLYMEIDRDIRSSVHVDFNAVDFNVVDFNVNVNVNDNDNVDDNSGTRRRVGENDNDCQKLKHQQQHNDGMSMDTMDRSDTIDFSKTCLDATFEDISVEEERV